MEDRHLPRCEWQPEWPGWSARGTLVLPLPVARRAPLMAGVTLDGVEFEPKPELHVTLMGSALGHELHANFDGAWLVEMLRKEFEALDWSFTRSGRLLLLRKTGLADGGAGCSIRSSSA